MFSELCCRVGIANCVESKKCNFRTLMGVLHLRNDTSESNRLEWGQKFTVEDGAIPELKAFPLLISAPF